MEAKAAIDIDANLRVFFLNYSCPDLARDASFAPGADGRTAALARRAAAFLRGLVALAGSGCSAAALAAVESRAAPLAEALENAAAVLYAALAGGAAERPGDAPWAFEEWGQIVAIAAAVKKSGLAPEELVARVCQDPANHRPAERSLEWAKPRSSAASERDRSPRSGVSDTSERDRSPRSGVSDKSERDTSPHSGSNPSSSTSGGRRGSRRRD